MVHRVPSTPSRMPHHFPCFFNTRCFKHISHHNSTRPEYSYKIHPALHGPRAKAGDPGASEYADNVACLYQSPGRQRGSIELASSSGSKDWFTWPSKMLPGASFHLSTTIYLPSWFVKSNDSPITTAEHSIDRIFVVDWMKTQ